MFSRTTAWVLALACCTVVFGDYIVDRKAAMELMKARKYEEALAALTKMANGEVTDFQKSDAMEQAAYCCDRLKRYDQAMETAKEIPLEAVSKTVQMTLMYRNRKWKEVIEQFGNEDINAWPDTVKSKAYRARGGSASRIKDGKLAVADLTKAAEYTMNRNDRGRVLNALGDAYRVLLKDDDKAIETYRRTYTESHGYKQCHAVIAVSGILSDRGKSQEALKELDQIDLDKIKGYWKAALLGAHGRALAAAGKKTEAIARYKEALQIKGVSGGQAKAYQVAIKELEKK